MIVVEDGHVSMSGIEGDGVGLPPIGERIGPLTHDLAGQRFERPFHRIALDLPAFFVTA
jgi:hypothetical protein